MNLNSLIERCKKKDRKAEKELFLRLAPILLTDCRRYAVDDSEAKDFLQDGIIQIFENLHKFDMDKGFSFIGWSRTVCRNKVVAILRGKKHFSNTVPIEQVSNLSEKIEITRLEDFPEELLLSAIQKLPIGYKTVLNLYIFEGYQHNRIAEELDISPSTSRSQFARAKKMLKKLLLEEKIKHHEWREREAL